MKMRLGILVAFQSRQGIYQFLSISKATHHSENFREHNKVIPTSGLMKIFAHFFISGIFWEALWVNFFHTFVLFQADLGEVFGLLHFYFCVPSILSGFFGSKILSSFWVWVW
jgi:hypothetical protein